jgi:hypothetical protein
LEKNAAFNDYTVKKLPEPMSSAYQIVFYKHVLCTLKEAFGGDVSIGAV